jgi:hypothetical protein
MIEMIKDPHGRILAVCEYVFCDKDSMKPTGDVMFVGETYINPDCCQQGLMIELIERLYDMYPDAKKVQFFRSDKYPGRKGKTYTRKQVAKLIGRQYE